MRMVVKGGEDSELRRWKRENASAPQNIHYDNLLSDVRRKVLIRLSEEQNGLCAYTMRRLYSSDGGLNAHIEHIFPRAKHPTRSLDWDNLVACVPAPGKACLFGAIQKGGYDPATKPFISPINKMVETAFRYRENGEVDGLDPNASAMVDEAVLNLNIRSLINDRKAKCVAALKNRPTAAEARRRAQALRIPDKNGQLEPYCHALIQVLEAYAERREKTANRRAGSKRE
jgi:uncharacterized protein (TIGR02646 family)